MIPGTTSPERVRPAPSREKAIRVFPLRRISPAVLCVLCVSVVDLLFPRTATAQPSTSTSTSAPSPESVAEISARISSAWADVPSYAYVLETTLESAEGPVKIREERAFARPDAFVSEMTVVEHPNAASRGTVVRSVARGDRAWQLSRAAPGSGAATVARLREAGDVPEEKLADYEREVETPRVIRFDLSRLRASGVGPEDFLFAHQPHDPLRDLDPATVRVEKSDAKSWTLIGTARRGPKLPKATGVLRLTVDRASLELRRVETLGEANARIATTTVAGIDRDAKMPASRFEFVSPEGAKTTDNTQIVLETAQRERGGKKP